MMIVFWVIVIAVIVFLVRYGSARGLGTSELRETALDILKKRYARGEITKEEYERMKEDLKE